MANSGITLLGLGPGDPALLTRQAWQILEEAPEIYLRTRQHSALSGFPPGLRVYSFDHLYENGESFESVYEQIVNQVLALGSRPQGVIYAVPGHPFVAEATSPEIVRRARQSDIPVQVVEGLSFLDATFGLLGVDPFPHTALVDALELASLHFPPFPPVTPALIAQIHSPAVAAEVKLVLTALYPDEHPVQLVHRAGMPQAQVEALPLYAIDRSPGIGLQTCLYLPPLAGNTSFEDFQEIIAHLRAPEGCPWDREQTHQSLRPHLLEESYEVLSALDAEDPDALREELGDLLLQIVLHAQIASEYGEFNMSDVLRAIHAKLVLRHPHVFTDLRIPDPQGVIENWERIKAAEREASGKQEEGLLAGVSLSLPALSQAQSYQERAARVGFDWPEIRGVLDKIAEEVEEVRAASAPEEKAGEVGDLLFAVVNLARWVGLDAESALREANARFRRRFARIEAAARAEGRPLAEFSLEDLDALWEAAKGAEGDPG
jgi:tetrapyrrole methylase family protein/MazG family protein